MPAAVNYRKIWESHYGPIPTDEFGITYDIHHINGNRKDNRIENLIAVSVVEHYKIHYSQGDYSSCMLIGKRIGIKTDICGNKNPFYGKKHTKESMLMMVKSRKSSGNGDYHFGKNPFLSQTLIEKTKKRMIEKNPMKDDDVKRNMKLKKVQKMGFDSFDDFFVFLEENLNAGKSLSKISKELNRDKGFVINFWRSQMLTKKRKEPNHA